MKLHESEGIIWFANQVGMLPKACEKQGILRHTLKIE